MTPDKSGVSSPVERQCLRLFISGSSVHSTRVVEQVRRLCEEHLPDAYELEVIDVRDDPETADREGILALPTLIRTSPEPVRRLIGDMSDARRVLNALAVYEPDSG